MGMSGKSFAEVFSSFIFYLLLHGYLSAQIFYPSHHHGLSEKTKALLGYPFSPFPFVIVFLIRNAIVMGRYGLGSMRLMWTWAS